MRKKLLMMFWILLICEVAVSCKKSSDQKNKNDKEAETVFCDDDAHEFVLSDTKEPNCVEEGFRQYRCLKCGAEKKDTIEALGHKYSDT